jgi:protein-S-isoprenylcysteine O-methyltransferase Ste14
MQHLTLWQIEMLPWYAFLIVWAIGALKLKPTKAAEPDAARLFTGIVMACALALLFSHWVRGGILGMRVFPDSPGLERTGVALTFAGAAFAILARMSLGQNWSSRVTLKVGHELIRSGPYKYVRHPIYTGILLAIVGTAIVVGEWRGIFAIALSIIALGLKAQREELLLSTEFGGGYRQYREQTGFLIPRL